MGQAHRFSGEGKPYEGLTTIRRGKVDWAGHARLVPEMLAQPLRWKKPQRIFVNSMSDLFHESLSNEDIAAVFMVMAACPQHTFQVLTKRPKRAMEWFRWPLPNVHLGVSVEDQATADERIPLLLQCPAAVRWVSAEPLLGLVDLGSLPSASGIGKDLDALNNGGVDPAALVASKLDWVVVGGESGHGARPCNVDWIRSIVSQCKAARVPVFVKQLGSKPRGWCAGNVKQEPYCDIECDVYEASEGGKCEGRCYWMQNKKGGDPDEWPVDLRVRKFPEAQWKKT